jgi:signal transduction histidine kinase
MELFLDFRTSPAGRTAQELDQARRLLGAYQTALGHELPNQLVIVQAFARMLQEQEGARLSEEGRQLLGRLAATAQRTDTFVRRLAEVGRLCREPPFFIAAGGPEVVGAKRPPPPGAARHPPTAVPLGEVAREAFAEVNWAVGGGAAIRYDLVDPLPAVPVARPALHRVLAELIRNSASAASPDRPLRVAVGGENTPAGCTFWVRDNGRGLSASQLPGLFDPFAPGRNGPGAGLGLFLVRQLVAHWGGTLAAHSEPGVGTTFSLWVPCP